MEITEEEYSLTSLLNDACNLVYFRARNKGLDFLTEVEETIPDRDKIRDETREEIREIVRRSHETL